MCHRYKCDHEPGESDYYIDGVGYLCAACVDEFKSILHKEGITHLPEEDLLSRLKYFLKSPKSEKISIDKFFEQHKK